jgi:hypothetical protein
LVFLRSVRRLLVTASVVPSSPILVTLMKKALSSYETSVLRISTRRNTPGDAILHSRGRESLKSYKEVVLFKIDIFHGGYSEEWRLPWCNSTWLVRTDVSEENITSTIRVERISEIGTSAVRSSS